MPLGQRSDDMHHASGMMSGSVTNQSGINSSFSSNVMDETDDYMDYMGGGGSPLGLSSESSNQDRSCTSTPVGNDGSPAGKNVLKKKKKKRRPDKCQHSSSYVMLHLVHTHLSYPEI